MPEVMRYTHLLSRSETISPLSYSIQAKTYDHLWTVSGSPAEALLKLHCGVYSASCGEGGRFGSDILEYLVSSYNRGFDCLLLLCCGLVVDDVEC